MAGDFKTKKIPAPEQPAGLSISAYRIGKYVDELVSNNDHKGYKRIFEQIKILVKTIMHVLCEKRLVIDFPLWHAVNSIVTPEGINDTIITFPVKKYEYERWVNIFRALIPSVAYPFNAYCITNPLNTSQSIDIISDDSSNGNASDDYSNDISDDSCSTIVEHHEEWYETAVYAYQNLLLTSSSKKREMIDLTFQEENAKARNRGERNKAHETRSKSINALKNGTYEWVNRIGHIVKDYKYIRIHSMPHLVEDINGYVRHSDLLLLNGVLNNGFVDTGLIDEPYKHLLTRDKSYPPDAYMNAILYYHSKSCSSEDPVKEHMLYDTIADLLQVYYRYHHRSQSNGLLLEFDIQGVVEAFLNGLVQPQNRRIRTAINRLTDDKFNDILDELRTYDTSMVREELATNIMGEPQQKCIIRMMSMFDIGDLAIDNIRKHKAKAFESYHNTVAWAILYRVIPFDVIHDESIFVPRYAADIYTALLSSSKINPLLIKDNYDAIKQATDELSTSITGYAKYRLSDAFIEANNAIINL